MKKIILKEICHFLNGYAFKSKQYVDDGIRIIRIANVQKGKIIDDAPCFYPINTKNEIKKYMLFENDLLISLTGNVGRVGLLTKGMLPAALNQRVSCIRILDKDVVFFKYLYYYLQQNSFERDCIKASNGVAQLNLSTKWLKNYQIYLPSLKEQQCIVTKIEELFSKLDKGIDELNKIKVQLKIYRQAVLKEVFSGLENSKVPLKDMCERIFDGPFGSNLKTVDYTTSGIRVVRLENLKHGWFDDSKQSFVTQEKYNSISKHTVYPADLIVSTFISDNIKVCQMPEYIGYAVNKADCVGIRLKNTYSAKYVMYYLMTKDAYDQLSGSVHGATRPRVNTTQIKNINISIADVDVQNNIVDDIESRLSVCDKIERAVDESLQKAESLRQSILKQAFEGKLV